MRPRCRLRNSTATSAVGGCGDGSGPPPLTGFGTVVLRPQGAGGEETMMQTTHGTHGAGLPDAGVHGSDERSDFLFSARSAVQWPDGWCAGEHTAGVWSVHDAAGDEWGTFDSLHDADAEHQFLVAERADLDAQDYQDERRFALAHDDPDDDR